MSPLPTFSVVGAPKCGTTSLFHYLGQHPGIFLPRQKELHYFTYDILVSRVAGPGDDHVVRYACATRAEYERAFEPATTEPALGDVSPSYFEHPEVATRIRDELDDPRVVILLRNPIERTYSQYMHLVRDTRETLTFCEALDAEPERVEDGWGNIWHYTSNSFFADPLQTYLDTFGSERTKVILFRDFIQQPEETLSDLCGFLEVDPGWRFESTAVHNRSGRPRSRLLAAFATRPGPVVKRIVRALPEPLVRTAKQALSRANVREKAEMDPDSRERLRELFQEDVARVADLLERDLGFWGIQ